MDQNKIIRVVIFSYKNKNLESVVQSVIANTRHRLCVDVIDKNPIDRRETFSKYKNVSYHYQFWNKMDSPTIYKNMFIDVENFDYFLFISDDVILKENWDTELIKMYKNNMIISGQGKSYIYHKNKFYLGKTTEPTDSLSINNFIDRNFVFGSAETFFKVSYPTEVKYLGEEEILSINAFCNGIDIYSLPTGFYEDLQVRSVENMYTPFSIQHGYNKFVDLIKNGNSGNIRTVDDFVRYHRIEVSNINRLPFERNDVLYDAEKALHDDKGEKFFNRRTAV